MNEQSNQYDHKPIPAQEEEPPRVGIKEDG